MYMYMAVVMHISADIFSFVQPQLRIMLRAWRLASKRMEWMLS